MASADREPLAVVRVQRHGDREQPLEIVQIGAGAEDRQIDGPLCGRQAVAVGVADAPRGAVEVPDRRLADVLRELRAHVGVVARQGRRFGAHHSQDRTAATRFPPGFGGARRQALPRRAQHLERQG